MGADVLKHYFNCDEECVHVGHTVKNRIIMHGPENKKRTSEVHAASKSLLTCSEDGGSKLLRNFGDCFPIDTASCPRRL